MLDDQERQTLRELERQFMAEDPQFSQTFRNGGEWPSTLSLHWAYALPRWVYLTAIVVVVGFSLLMIIVKAPGIALACAVLATMIAMVQKRRDKPGRRKM